MHTDRISRRAMMKLAGAAALAPAGKRAAAQTQPTADHSVIDCRCEYAVNPLGIEETAPRLSWAIQAEARSWKQTSYQILVSTSQSAVSAGSANLWDSGRVRSPQSAHIVYSGKPLLSRQTAWWTVRVWDQAGRVSQWSKPGFWTMGLLTEADWKESAWIGHDAVLENTQDKMPGDGPMQPPKAKPAPYLRKVFTVERKPVRAQLFACGLGYAELHLNGKKVGGEIERDPGFTDFNKRVLYVTHDVTALLASGKNALGAILGTGWYDVHDVATWHFNTAPWRARPVLRLLLAIEYPDGSTAFVASDESWKAAEGPIVRDGIYSGEFYDARREMPGWDSAGFDDSTWKQVLNMPAPRGKLVARSCPPVAIVETIVPAAIGEPSPGKFIVDMGRNIAGHAQLRVKAPRGTSITMRYAEVLNPDGTLNSRPIDHFMAQTEPRQPFQQDTYICRGEGEEIWEPRFSYSGFQYIEVTGFPGRPTIDNFRGRFACTAMESAGSFECSDQTLNKIQSATRAAFLSNAQSIPTDCPQREKNGWTGDAQLAAEAGLMNFRSATFYTKWLDDFADSQRPEGGVPVLVPNGGWGNGERWPGLVTPPWDAAYPVIAWELYRFRGDTRILERHYPRIRKYVDYFATFEKDGVTPGLGIGDWSPWKTETPLDYISTAYLYLDLVLLSQIASVLRKNEDQSKYSHLAEKVKRGFHTRFYDPAKRTYSNGSQTALSTALFFDLAPKEIRQEILQQLAADVERLGHLDVGIIGAKNLLRALSEGGRTDLAYRIVVQPEMPGWGNWIRRGATTLWEGWKEGPSYNHIMFGDVSNWMFQWIGGIAPDPAAPGFGRILIRPTPVPGVSWAKTSHHSMHGQIVSEWKKDADTFRLTVLIPANAAGTVILPAGTADRITEGGLPITESRGVREGAAGASHRTFTVGSGRYEFEVRRA